MQTSDHKPPHASNTDQVLNDLATDARGLTTQEAARRLAASGPNRLPAPPRDSLLKRFFKHFHDILIYILLIAAGITALLGHWIDTGVIVGVVVINAIIGFIQEGKAEEALAGIRKMLSASAQVRRQGEWTQIDADGLVPGDIVRLKSGDRVPADLRLLEATNLRIEESALTGESVPSDKSADPVAADAGIGDRFCMAYSGTLVAAGRGLGVITATGPNTEIGRINRLIAEVETLQTPLTRQMAQFSKQLSVVIVGLAALMVVVGIGLHAFPLGEVFLAAIGFAVAAIPEGLPAILTITLALGVQRMARCNAITRKLTAVETLGSVTVVCSDKTGTLTRNEMTAVCVMLPAHSLEVSGAGYAPEGGFSRDGATVDAQRDEALQELARCALLCNDAQLKRSADSGWQLVGDPTEGALLTLARKAGLDPAQLAKTHPRVDEIPFESEHRFMATLHHDHTGHTAVLLKGAPERVLDLCTDDGSGQPLDRDAWQTRMHRAAGAGQRVLALARRQMPADTTALAMDDIAPRFTLLGLIGLIDPPREEAIAAVAECQRAGLRVKMITGDHAVTAAAIGRQLGLNADHALTGDMIGALDDEALRRHALDTDVFARASPEHKLRLVGALQAQGELVAMTGDGVNDAPALKAADIGVAMGFKGTDAAREAADLVLTDDNFATIARAVREGRVVFDNVKKSLLFILPTNGGEAGVILLAVFLGLALPVTAGQILWVNMITAVTLALALAFEPAEPGVMLRPPRRPGEPLITGVLAARIAYVSVLMIAVTFTVFEWELARGSSVEVARTAAVNMLVIGELVYLFNVRHFTAPALNREILTGNPVALWVSVILIVFQLLFTYAPPLQQVFHTAALDVLSWLVIVALGAGKFLAVEAEKAVLRRLQVRSM